jgi:rod shape-determining protein MreC
MSPNNLFKKITITAVSLSLLWVIYRTALLPRISSYIAYPVLQGYRMAVAPLKQWAERRDTIWQIRSQLHEQTRELTDLRAQNIFLRASMAYMQGIDELRTFKKRYQKEGKIAHILARDFSEQSHHFYIDLGAQDTIEKDMVVTYKNNLIGKISEVYPWYSKVCLITDRHCKVSAYGASTRAHGIHEGLNQYGVASLCHVSHLAQAKKGELVFSSGEGLLFPEGLALGRITSCQTKGLYQEIAVKPLCNLKDLEYCFVATCG